jgi:6-pyruvoyltetrahydropterin/6-carboxytetrahydropterin synthase
MMESTLVQLSREVRFGLSAGEDGGEAAEAKGSANTFAGSPMLEGVAAFLSVRVTVEGAIDPRTGMLVNIKVIDALVREAGVAALRERMREGPRRIGALVMGLFERLRGELKGPSLLQVELALSPYLRVAAHREELPMVRLSQRFEFSAAHRLHSEALSEAENRELFGRCNNPNGHGHNYELEVTVAGTPDAGSGTIMAVGDLQRIVKERVIEVYDHKHLNLDCADFQALNPTVENIARVLYGRLKPHLETGRARLASVRLWETPKTMCEYSE